MVLGVTPAAFVTVAGAIQACNYAYYVPSRRRSGGEHTCLDRKRRGQRTAAPLAVLAPQLAPSLIVVPGHSPSLLAARRFGAALNRRDLSGRRGAARAAEGGAGRTPLAGETDRWRRR